MCSRVFTLILSHLRQSQWEKCMDEASWGLPANAEKFVNDEKINWRKLVRYAYSFIHILSPVHNKLFFLHVYSVKESELIHKKKSCSNIEHQSWPQTRILIFKYKCIRMISYPNVACRLANKVYQIMQWLKVCMLYNKINLCHAKLRVIC